MSKLSDFMGGGGGLSWDIEGFMDNMVFVESVELTTSGTHTFTEDSVVILSIRGASGTITASGGATLCKLDDETFLTITGGGAGGGTSTSYADHRFYYHTVGLIGTDGEVSTSSSFPLLLPNHAPNGQLVPASEQRRGQRVRSSANSTTSYFTQGSMSEGRGAGGAPGTALVMFGVETGQELAITLGASGAQAIINIYKG